MLRALHLLPAISALLLLLAVSLLPTEAADSLVADGATLERVADGYKFTEGPAVDREGNVFFTDQPNDRILKWSLDGSVATWLQPCGRSNGLFFDQQGNLLACADGQNELWSIQHDKTHTVLLKGYEEKLFNGPNDLWIAADGSCYFTDPYYRRDYWTRENLDAQLPKRVYRFSPDSKTLQIAADDFKQPNGIVGDPQKKLLYVADIGDKKTYRFQIADDGSLTHRTLFCEMGSDGMTLDTDGNLYLTGKGVTVFSAEGKKLQNIEVPEGWTANVCFGGADRDLLFITASDSLYQVKMKTSGIK
ncbi:SMP-30/gluconolactonase/LRE family protein [Aureliella helgolandensis]|uniref:Gluconolactonase n=1 Tax=Aureliella helgolandensis TaxID=2527968 RepID=A0A518GFU1_9BACT|nr:SMP-30/gluconolactonase/LRE family protein [Aureliella helgolandensis]QDV27469.1 Gluconolactonase precursor [Aureliella helgolandensis]